MDNPQHYQPLSHALHPPQAQAQPSYVTPGMYQNKPPSTVPAHRAEEEEEDDDDDDEGIVEEQLSRNDADPQGSSSSSPLGKSTGTTDTRVPQSQTSAQGQTSPDNDRKRRPGRPRGSKNRKPRVGQASAKQETTFYAQGQPSLHPVVGAAPPQHPDVNVHNQQYYEFQWRVLNLCAEFYGAAEELVKGTPPLVIAQCYQMGPNSSVDPLNMLGDAKRICDTLLANPSQLISSPPPPMYPVMPTMYKPVIAQPAPPASTSAHAATASKSATPSNIISNPQSFVVSLGTSQAAYPGQYPMYAPPGQYPTTPYYQYPGYHPTPSYYAPQPVVQPHTQPAPPPQPQAQSQAQPQPQNQNQSQSTVQHPQSTPTAAPTAAAAAATSPPSAAGNSGTWSDEETEQLKKLAEDSRSAGTSGEIEWDWVVHRWGNTRTRHQILIKATSLGLKESTSRGLKRRRDTDGPHDAASPSVPPTPTIAHSTHSTHPNPSAAPSASPAQSQSASTPAASPALQHQQRPPPKPPTSTSSLPWPMPTVAVNTPSPVVAAATIGQDPQRTSYYRPRPSQADSSSKSASGTHGTTAHQYMYQPNGSAGSGSRLAKENGK
ncbi:hypothetical protein BDZ94DRAFT_1247460 [Collybia nuda]|uniref:Myb-like domain-containing protein n=1 Tax=Collybia nuda TaxID=64659 RepID=A0A9P6CPP3_9AGAR|nr:hypothetical protein BDZ94DRAFT_1247460 [Collybia nuda]